MSQKGEKIKENEENFLCQGLAFIIREREKVGKKVGMDIYIRRKGKKIDKHVSFYVSFVSVSMSVLCHFTCQFFVV